VNQDGCFNLPDLPQINSFLNSESFDKLKLPFFFSWSKNYLIYLVFLINRDRYRENKLRILECQVRSVSIQDPLNSWGCFDMKGMVLDVNLRTQTLNFEGFSFFICNSRVFIKCIWFLYMESHSIFVNYQEKNVFFLLLNVILLFVY